MVILPKGYFDVLWLFNRKLSGDIVVMMPDGKLGKPEEKPVSTFLNRVLNSHFISYSFEISKDVPY